jgi:4-hydroxy-tetrahydrodipicolinate synthase
MHFEGIIPAVTTPFDASGAVDPAALRSNVSELLDAGMTGIVATGTMGEAGSLTREERAVVVRAVAEEVDGRVPVIAGVSSGSARQSLEYATDAREAGASAIMCLPPLGYRADPAELIVFYSTVADGCGLPVMAYNNPEASGVDMSPELIVGLYERVEGIVAIKECSGDARRLRALIDGSDGLEVLVGGDDWALEGFAAGATGWVSGVAVVAPTECVELYRAVRDGQMESARAIYARMLPLARFDMTPKLVQYFKAAQDRVGFAGGPTRAPRMPLAAAEREALEAALVTLRASALA